MTPERWRTVDDSDRDLLFALRLSWLAALDDFRHWLIREAA
jgi:hypothetical protein